ncbi:hypothetical protein [Ammoniphilus sp. YIM 78166]|nr:hypothetical protein [Ammoniphilus sp. YIM 78166]
MNIIDGMDSARFRSENDPNNKQREEQLKKEEKEMPMVLRNLKNGS